jgi:hypothetical protein
VMQWRQKEKKQLEGCEGSRSGLLYHACFNLQEKQTHTKNIPRRPATHKSKAESSSSLGSSWIEVLDSVLGIHYPGWPCGEMSHLES